MTMQMPHPNLNGRGAFLRMPVGVASSAYHKIFVYIDEMTPQTNKFDLNYQPRRLSKFRSETLKVFLKKFSKNT